MIKVYTPNALIVETQRVIKQHPMDGSAHAQLSDLELRELLERICKSKPEKLSILAMTLSKRQNMALADYFPQNKYHHPVENIATVLTLNMTGKMLTNLFSGWQSFPRNLHLLNLLVENDVPEKRPQDFPLPMGLLSAWRNRWQFQQTYYRAIRRYAVPNEDDNVLYADQFSKSCLNPRTPLYISCYTSYLSECSLQKLLTEGDTMVSFGINQASDKALCDKIMENMLLQADKHYDKLIAFPRCYRSFFNRYKTPTREQFSSEIAFRTYTWWYNYQLIVEGFNKDGDRRRVEFWSQYLGKCMVSRLIKQQFLFMDFGKYVAVESEVMGTLYFYSKPYFDYTVKTYLALHTSQEGKSWMKNISESVYKKTHQGYWQGEVAFVMRRLGMN